MQDSDKSLDLTVFSNKYNKSLDLCYFYTQIDNHINNQFGGKHDYKKEWYKKNNIAKNIKGYNKQYYQEHKNEIKHQRSNSMEKKF